jgi:hypothetical protein
MLTLLACAIECDREGMSVTANLGFRCDPATTAKIYEFSIKNS